MIQRKFGGAGSGAGPLVAQKAGTGARTQPASSSDTGNLHETQALDRPLNRGNATARFAASLTAVFVFRPHAAVPHAPGARLRRRGGAASAAAMRTSSRRPKRTIDPRGRRTLHQNSRPGPVPFPGRGRRPETLRTHRPKTPPSVRHGQRTARDAHRHGRRGTHDPRESPPRPCSRTPGSWTIVLAEERSHRGEVRQLLVEGFMQQSYRRLPRRPRGHAGNEHHRRQGVLAQADRPPIVDEADQADMRERRCGELGEKAGQQLASLPKDIDEGRLRAPEDRAQAREAGGQALVDQGLETSLDDGIGSVRIPYGDCRRRTPREEMAPAPGRHGQAGRSAAQVIEHGGEHLLGLVGGGGFIAGDTVQQVFGGSQQDRIVEDVVGKLPVPRLPQLPSELLHEGPVAGHGLQLHQGEGSRPVENAARVAEHRVSGQLAFDRAQDVAPGCDLSFHFAAPGRVHADPRRPGRPSPTRRGARPGRRRRLRQLRRGSLSTFMTWRYESASAREVARILPCLPFLRNSPSRGRRPLARPEVQKSSNCSALHIGRRRCLRRVRSASRPSRRRGMSM